MRQVETSLRDHLASVVTGLGYEFVGCELLKQGRSALLRIFIDSEQGITVDDCSRVSRQISAMLDVLDPIQGQYSLEISSPGINRPLFELAQYQKQIGNTIKVRLQAPLNERRNFVGILVRVEEATIHLLVDAAEVTLPFSDIDKANVIADR